IRGPLVTVVQTCALPIYAPQRREQHGQTPPEPPVAPVLLDVGRDVRGIHAAHTLGPPARAGRGTTGGAHRFAVRNRPRRASPSRDRKGVGEGTSGSSGCR